MLAVGITRAKKYSNKPCLICKDLNDPSKSIYWVEDASLPCMSCKGNAIDLVSQKEIFALKKKYRVSDKTLQKITNFYKSDKEVLDLKDLGSKIMMEEIEDVILKQLKSKYRDPNASFMPYYDSELSGQIALHTSLYGPSSSGKSTICSKIIEHNFAQGSIIWVLSPTATSDPVWKNLQKTLGKRKVRLLDTKKVIAPIDLEQIGRGNILIFDDQCAVRPENERYTSQLCSRALYEGRHMTSKDGRGIVCFSIFHDAFSRSVKSIKSSAIESSRVILFPNQQRHVCKKVMKNRLGFSASQISAIFAFVEPKDRWIMLVQHCPSCVISKTGVMLL